MAALWHRFNVKAVFLQGVLFVACFFGNTADNLLTRVAAGAGCAQTPRNFTTELDCVLKLLYDGGSHREFIKDFSLGRQGTYGEVTASGLASLLRGPPFGTEILNKDAGQLEHVPAHYGGALLGPGDIFWDLGSGAGRAVLQVVLSTDVDKSIGVELSPIRHAVAEHASNLLKELLANVSAADADSRWKLLRGNIRDYMNLDGDLKDATVIYMAALCFPTGLLFDLGHFVPRLAPGTVVLSLKQTPGCHRGLVTIRMGGVKTTWNDFSPVWAYVVAPQDAIGAPPPASFGTARMLRAREEAARKIVVEGERRWGDHRVAGEHQDVAECMFEELYALVEVRQEAEVEWAREQSLAGLVERYNLTMSSKGEGGRTVAHVATSASARSLKLVLEIWPQAVYDVNDLGETPLHICGDFSEDRMASLQSCQALLDAGAEIERRDLSGKTPLLRILNVCHGLNPRYECTRSVNELIRRGANVSVADFEGSTPLHYAMHWGSQDIVRTIITAVGDTAKDAHKLLMQGDKDGDTPVHQLCNEDADGAGGPLASWLLSKVGAVLAATTLKMANNLGQTPPEVCKASRKVAVLTMFDFWEASARREAEKNDPKNGSEVGIVERMRQVFKEYDERTASSSSASRHSMHRGSHPRHDHRTATQGPSRVSERPDL